MSDEIAIKVENVSKTFKLPHEKATSIKSAVVNFYRRNKTYEAQKVLDNVSFEIKKGEFFGIVGRNGSGKSTLLKLLAGIYSPTAGSIHIKGKLTPFIELGVGFNPELTGRENVFLNGALLGFSRTEMNEMYEDIVNFAELQRFMDQKLKNYSSGMQVRLAFSIAIRAKSDILLIDEVLAVGDAAFQSKCYDYFTTLKNTGVTVVFVSHDKPSLERFCKNGVLVNEGAVVTKGPIKSVLAEYSNIVLDELENSATPTYKARPAVKKRNGAKISKVISLDQTGKIRSRFNYGEKILIQFDVNIAEDIINPILGVTLWEKDTDKPVYSTNTLMENIVTGEYKNQDVISVKVELPEHLNDGEYILEPAIANDSGTVFYDQLPDATRFFIRGSSNPYAILAADKKIKIERTHG
jgi:ABC-2 type transport system ATP-binding protein